MNQKRVNVKIDALGRVQVEAEGFNGESCAAATKPIEQALAAGAPMQREYKPEWHNMETNQQQEQIQQW